METKTQRILISGKVQGVGFRYFALQSAIALNINGTVRNMEDGKVEIIAQGRDLALRQYARRIKRGPRFGEVRGCFVDTLAEAPEFDNFSIIR